MRRSGRHAAADPASLRPRGDAGTSPGGAHRVRRGRAAGGTAMGGGTGEATPGLDAFRRGISRDRDDERSSAGKSADASSTPSTRPALSRYDSLPMHQSAVGTTICNAAISLRGVSRTFDGTGGGVEAVRAMDLD